MLTRPKLYRLSCSVLAFAALGQHFVDLLAGGADRIALGVAARHPHLAAERGDRRARHHAVDDLALVDVVREPLVIAVTMRQIGAHVLLDACALVRKNLSLAHVGESSSARRHRRPEKPRRRRRPKNATSNSDWDHPDMWPR